MFKYIKSKSILIAQLSGARWWLTGLALRHFVQWCYGETSIVHDDVPSWLRHRIIHGHALEKLMMMQRNLDVFVSADRSDDGCIDVVQIGGELDHDFRVAAFSTIRDVFHVRQMRCADAVLDPGELREHRYRYLKLHVFFSFAIREIYFFIRDINVWILHTQSIYVYNIKKKVYIPHVNKLNKTMFKEMPKRLLKNSEPLDRL